MIVGLIPARYASTRFPGKPLERLGGMSILERCYRQCLKAELLQQVWIATDDERIAGHARSFGADVLLTDPAHLSGTDHVVKVVLDAAGRALYFSRSPIPYDRQAILSPTSGQYLQHIGLYGYRAPILAQIAALAPGILEQIEVGKWISHTGLAYRSADYGHRYA
jgi:CMP-2-keto-3-deoxyoctulosonic acid synthetase